MAFDLVMNNMTIGRLTMNHTLVELSTIVEIKMVN